MLIFFRSDLGHAECARVRMERHHDQSDRRLNTSLREHWTGAWLGVVAPSSSVWLRLSKERLITGTSGYALVSQMQLFEATSTGSFPGVRISSVASRWSCSKTDKSNCCSHETLYTEATCGFNRRDLINCARTSEVGNDLPTTASRLVPTHVSWLLQFPIFLESYVHASGFSGRIFNLVHSSQSSWPLLSMRHVPLDEFSILSTQQSSQPLLSMRHVPLDEFLMTNEIDVTTCHHQRQGPHCTFSYSATMVPVQDSWFVHRSDSPVLTFLKLEFFLNEHGVIPTSLSQPNVGISAQSEPVDHPDGCDCHTNRSRSELTVAALTTTAN